MTLHHHSSVTFILSFLPSHKCPYLLINSYVFGAYCYLFKHSPVLQIFMIVLLWCLQSTYLFLFSPKFALYSSTQGLLSIGIVHILDFLLYIPQNNEFILFFCLWIISRSIVSNFIQILTNFVALLFPVDTKYSFYILNQSQLLYLFFGCWTFDLLLAIILRAAKNT